MRKGEFLERIMKVKGYNFPALAKLSGVPYTTIKSMFERDLVKASVDNAIKVCKALGVSVEWIYENDEFDENDIIRALNDDFKVQSSNYTVDLPLFGSIAAGALSTVDGVTKENIEFLAMPNQFLGKHSNCTNLFAMIVNGESMNKIIKHGSVVVAKPLEIDQYKSGDIVIFSYNHEYSLKRYAPDELEGFVLFKSESDDSSFKDIPIPKSEVDTLKLYGKVVYYGTTL